MPNARLRLLPALIATVLLAGWRDPELPLQRLVEEEPNELFHTDLVARPEVVFRWQFESPDALSDWRIAKAESVEPRADGGVLLRGPRVDLSRDVEIETWRVDALEIDALSMQAGELQLAWAKAGANFRVWRQLTVPLHGLSSGFDTRTFYLRDLPGWSGRVGRIRLRLPQPGMVIREIRGVSVRFQAADLAAVLARPWKVDLDSEVRTARLAPPGAPLEWPVTVTEGSRLRFAYGVGPRTRGTIRFRISARRPDSETVQLFDELVGPAAEEAPRGWREGLVGLADLDRGDWTLLFETEDVDGGFAPVQGFPAWGHPEVLPGPRSGGPPNILLICIDTLRPDRLTFYGHTRPTSPNLERWAERSTAIFENVIAPTPSTLFSHASMFSGLWSLKTGIDRVGRVPRETTLLAEHLRRTGYTTHAVTGGGWMHPFYGFARGFDAYRYWPGTANKDRELADGVERADRWLRSGPSSPFFLFLHTYEVHSPFEARQPFFEKLGGSADDGSESRVHYEVISDAKHPRRTGGADGPKEVSVEELSRLYDAGIAYADDQLARVLATLEQTGLDRETVVVLTSDHGESLGEKGLYGHGNLAEATLRVPLVIALPGGKGSPRRVPQQVSLTDLTPTLLELAGAAVPEGLDGRSLVPLIEGRTTKHRPVAWTHSPEAGTSLRISNRIKYVYRHSPWGPKLEAEELYRLEEDPAEERNVVATAPVSERLRNRVRTFLHGAHEGLRMAVENSSELTFRGTVSGAMLLPGTAQVAPEMPCACLTRSGLDEMTLEVPPGKRFELYFELSRATEMRIDGGLEGGLDGRESLDKTIDLTALTKRWRWTAEEGAMRIDVWWQGGLATASEAATPEPELVKQLRDLGYLD